MVSSRKAIIAFALLAAFILFGAFLPMASYGEDLAQSKPLELVKSYPEDGGKDMPIQNLGVKLYFDADVYGDKLREKNIKLIHFLDPKGKSIKTSVYFSHTEKGYVLATIQSDKNLASNKKYQLVVEEGFAGTDGRSIAKDLVISFKTVNSDLNNKIYMALMAVLFIGMFGFMAFKTKRDAAKKAAEGKHQEKTERVNPYQLAKKKGISVEKAVQEIERKKKKKEAQDAKKKEHKNSNNRGEIKMIESMRTTKELGITYKPKR
jgi:hypothetical protein